MGGNATGGVTGTGGVSASGGTGGTVSSGGAGATLPGSGGVSASGGMGGTTSSGGAGGALPGTGGATSTGGTTSLGGSKAAGGTASSGGITGGSGSTFQDFLIRVKGDADHMAKLLPSNAIPAGVIDGLVNGAVVLTGPTLSPHIRGEVVLTESKVTLPGLVEKPTGAQATSTRPNMKP